MKIIANNKKVAPHYISLRMGTPYTDLRQTI